MNRSLVSIPDRAANQATINAFKNASDMTGSLLAETIAQYRQLKGELGYRREYMNRLVETLQWQLEQTWSIDGTTNLTHAAQGENRHLARLGNPPRGGEKPGPSLRRCEHLPATDQQECPPQVA